MSDFPCCTKVVTKTLYRIIAYSIADGSQRMSTSDDDEESANSYFESLKKNWSDKYKIEMTTESWEEEVCIECGKEA